MVCEGSREQSGALGEFIHYFILGDLRLHGCEMVYTPICCHGCGNDGPRINKTIPDEDRVMGAAPFSHCVIMIPFESEKLEKNAQSLNRIKKV